MAQIHYGRGYVYSLQYHIVWCVKYRHKILQGEVETKLKEILQEIAKEQGIEILAMETNADHVHLLVGCSPQHYIPDVIKVLKGVSAKRLFQTFPEIKSKLWGGHLWSPSYFVATVSENTEEQIKEYINSQKEKN